MGHSNSLAKLHFEELNDPESALEYLVVLNRYIPTYPGALTLTEKVTQTLF